MTKSPEWKIKMLLKALKRIFKTAVKLIERIENGEEIT